MEHESTPNRLGIASDIAREGIARYDYTRIDREESIAK